MRLLKIEILGFKSFADRQVVVVDEHVTGVIGPNGCGKSNIVDAIRWAMGEQSAKHLRGAGMSDVIFAGCSTRGPAGMAEVTLTFANQGELTAPHLDHPEIAITRRLYADGTSEYLINKVPCRLRDITDLLSGTGVGTKGYSIIEQGQVGRIVSSKPEERRHIIDEAAGITKFKAQKAAAQRKIDATRQNLLRVTDVLGELEGRLSTLHRQAQKAERYKRYRQELRDLDMWTASHKFLELGATGSVLEARREDLSQQVGDIRAALSAREAQIEARRLTLAEIERELSERQQAVFDLDNRIRLLEAEDDYRRREREGLLQSGAQARAEAEVAGRGLEHLEGELRQIGEQRRALGDGDGPEGQRSTVERLDEAHRRVEAQLADERTRLESCRTELVDRRAALAGAEARRHAHDEAMNELRRRGEQTREATAALQDRLGILAAQRDEARQALEAAEITVARLERRKTELDNRRGVLRNRVSAAEVELDTKRAEVHRCRSRLQSLEEIQNRYRGCHSGVQVVMQHREELEAASTLGVGGEASAPRVIHGILADYVSAPEHLETAVSAILGDRLEGVVVDEPSVAAAGVEILKREQEGRTTFLPRRGRPGAVTRTAGIGCEGVGEGAPLGWSVPADGVDRIRSGIEVVDLSETPRPPGALGTEAAGSSPGDEDSTAADDVLRAPGVVGRLRDLVSVTGELGPLARELLGDAIVVEGLGRALELWQTRDLGATLVTLDGDRLEPSGVVVGGSPTALNAALLQQKREIRELQEILEELGESFEQARGRHLALAQELADVEAAREQNEAEILAAEKSRLELQGQLDRARDEAERLSAERDQLEAEAATLAEEVERRRREIVELDRLLSEGRARQAELERAISAGEERVAELGRERERLSAALTDAKVELARWQQQSDALAEAHERLLRQAESERQRIRRLEETAAAAKAKVRELEAATEQARREREALVGRSREATAAVHDARERFEALRLELDEIEASMRTLRGDLDERRERLQEVELGLQEIGLERHHLLSDVRERFDAELTEVLVDYHDRPLVGEPEQARQKELKRILSRMGEVNLTAIDEYDEVSKRFEYLKGQKDDLEQAIAQLQEAIDRINKTTRERFKETFHAVDEKFQQIFPRLFNGGRAKLEMTDPSDLLTTGVEIVAQPPGKQLRSLDLLSGGEKALTATSLIFAIFLIKPSPFCLLDEVDAPLDDANVARFCQLVRELAGQTQFVIITHNKVTMETADRLYGVTMEQRGISKLVSVNLRRAVELAYN